MVKESVEKQMSQFVAHQFLTPKLKDFNNNTASVSQSHEKLDEHQFYQICLQNHTLPFVVELLKRAINKNKISYPQIKKTLVKTAFGIKHTVNRGDSEIDYTWFSLIDIGIREFFKQFRKAINKKQTDWRVTIDFLAPKFEAILREIVENAGDEVTKVEENGDSELKLLEKLFSSPVIEEIFNEDDIFLFKHTFTKVGWNIRNNVAHGLYKPIDYTLSKAILIFLCILRLNKITIYLANRKGQP
jgi:vacuolar-type H+-ATPase subunit E/Vma4